MSDGTFLYGVSVQGTEPIFRFDPADLGNPVTLIADPSLNEPQAVTIVNGHLVIFDDGANEIVGVSLAEPYTRRTIRYALPSAVDSIRGAATLESPGPFTYVLEGPRAIYRFGWAAHDVEMTGATVTAAGRYFVEETEPFA